jgi:hypothetical protein
MLGKVVDMQPTPTRARRRRNPARSLLSVLRGDKYMVGAYPPTRDGALDSRSAVGSEPSTTAPTAPAASATKEPE